jgi:hypothetical protein
VGHGVAALRSFFPWSTAGLGRSHPGQPAGLGKGANATSPPGISELALGSPSPAPSSTWQASNPSWCSSGLVEHSTLVQDLGVSRGSLLPNPSFNPQPAVTLCPGYQNRRT